MAGVSIVQICNFALAEVGGESIISLNDGTVEANQCALWYDASRRAVLESHEWNFANKRVSLPLQVGAPAFDFGYAFTLPADFIRIIGTEKEIDTTAPYNPEFNGYRINSYQGATEGRDRYKIEGGSLLYDDEVCNILYVFDQEDVTRFSALFVDALTAYLASRIAYKITGSRSMVEQLTMLFERRIKKAQLSDSQQGTTERRKTSAYLATRQGF